MLRCEAVENRSNPKIDMEMRENVTGNAAYKNERSERKEDEIDWTDLPNYPVMEVLSLLNLRDKASVSSVCKSWRDIASSPWLWKSLDIRNHKFNPEASNSLAGCCRLNAEASNSLAGRCRELQRRLKFSGGVDSVEAIIHLAATDLKDLRGDLCRDLTDAALSMLAAGHRYLQHLELGQLVNITSPAIGVVASSCPNLKTLRLSGMKNVEEEAIDSLVRCCPNLRELGLWDCINIDESAVGKAASLKFLSVAGCKNIKWNTVSQLWGKMPSLVTLDVSRTDITPAALSGLLKSQSLRVVSAFDCPILETSSFVFYINSRESGKVLLLTRFTDVLKVFHEAINYDSDLKEWLEWLLSHALIWVFKGKYGHGCNRFWVEQAAPILLCLLKNSHEDVRERAAAGIGTCANWANRKDADAFLDRGGIALLVELARHYSCEGVQSEAVKAIAEVCGGADIVKAVAGREEQVIIGLILGLVRSPNTLEAGVAAAVLWNISAANIDQHAGAIVDGGGVKALIYLLFKWHYVRYNFLAAATGALANLAQKNEDCRMELTVGGGVDALAVLANSCRDASVQNGTARCLLTLACYGNFSIAWRIVEGGGVPALAKLSSSSFSKFARFMATTALAFIFDGRMEEEAAASGLVIEGTTTPSTQIINRSKHMALQNIQAFIHTVLDLQITSSSETVRIENVETMSWDISALRRFVSMAQSNSIVLGTCATFALSQITMPGEKYSRHHASYLQQVGAGRVLSTIAAAKNTPPHTRKNSRIVLRNLGAFG